MLVNEILIFVKETLLSESSKAEDFEQPIQQITKSICQAKGITEQQMYETVLSYKIQSHMDGVLLPLITAIELSAIQCEERISLVTVQEKIDVPEQEELQCMKDNISIEEEKAVKVGIIDELQSSSQMSPFSARKDKAVTSSTPMIAKKTEVLLNTFST